MTHFKHPEESQEVIRRASIDVAEIHTANNGNDRESQILT